MLTSLSTSLDSILVATEFSAHTGQASFLSGSRLYWRPQSKAWQHSVTHPTESDLVSWTGRPAARIMYSTTRGRWRGFEGIDLLYKEGVERKIWFWFCMPRCLHGQEFIFIEYVEKISPSSQHYSLDYRQCRQDALLNDALLRSAQIRTLPPLAGSDSGRAFL